MNNIKFKKKLISLILILIKNLSSNVLAIDINFPPVEKNNFVFNYPKIDKNNINKGYEFKNFVIIGDSLSDIGSFSRENRYLAGGYNNKMWSEIITSYYTGKASAPPDKEGGSNYAETGAVASGKNHSDRASAESQINEYLKFNNNIIDPDNIYSIWLGAMDINLDLLNKPLNIFNYDFKQKEYTLNDAPKEIVKQSKKIYDLGAKYIIVTNIPDSASAPITAVFYTDVAESFLSSIPIVKNIVSIYFSKRREYVDNFLRNPKNRIHINNDKGTEYMIANGILGMQYLYPFIPKFIVRKMYMYAYNIQSDLTRQFSYSLNKYLEQENIPVVYIDFKKANEEVFKDPQSYGIDDVISPTCTLGYSAKLCDIKSPKYHDDKIYATSDWFHPSPFANELFAAYVISIFDAPLYATSITAQLKGINEARKNFLKNQLNNLRNSNYNKNENYYTTFAGYSATYNLKDHNYIDNKNSFFQNINVGIAFHPNNNLIIGSMFTGGLGVFNPYDNFKYDYNNQYLTLFTQNNFDNNLWINSNIFAGTLKANNIKRIIHGGRVKVNIESGKTSSYNYGFDLLGGYNIQNQNINQSPIIGISLNKYHVKKYWEKGKRSTAMHFNPKDLESNYITLGWKISNNDFNNGNNSIINTNLEINFNRILSSSPIIVFGAVNSTTTSFYRLYNLNKSWININAGVNKNITSNINIYSNLEYSGNFKKQQKFNFSIGLQSKF